MSDKECNCGHSHGHGCGDVCGEGCEHNHQEIITVVFDNDEEVQCEVIGIFEVNEKEYIAIAPINGESVLVYKYKTDGEDVILDQIDSEEEYKLVIEEFYKLIEADDNEILE